MIARLTFLPLIAKPRQKPDWQDGLFLWCVFAAGSFGSLGGRGRALLVRRRAGV